MKIIADQNISLIDTLFGGYGSITRVPAHAIDNTLIKKADILLVRSVTSVNRSLLNNTKVRFVGSVTAGHDHMDTSWLDTAGIHWATAKGANARAVAEYVLCCIAWLSKNNYFPKRTIHAGIIGVGQIGSLVAAMLNLIGFEVILNDPPRAQMDKNFKSYPLTAFNDLDLILLHTPLTKKGEFPTYHLFNANRLTELKPGTVIINTARGAIINNTALVQSNHILACLDVWENEPNINLTLFLKTLLGTPHVAGYTQPAKTRAAYAIFQKASSIFNFPNKDIAPAITTQNKLTLQPNSDWRDAVLAVYNPEIDFQHMRSSLTDAKDIAYIFENLRSHYTLRPEFNHYKISKSIFDAKNISILKKLGFRDC